MCGFVGNVTFHGSGELRFPPDFHGYAFARRGSRPVRTYASERMFMAHSLLPIRAPQVDQPAVSPSGRYVYVYNGEDYSSTTRGDSDTRLIGVWLDRLGVTRTFDQLDGEFALAVFDRLNIELALGRDAAGVKPLFVAPRGGAIVFGSNAADVALLAEAEISSERVAEYVALLRIRAGAAWADVDAVEPGHMYVWRATSFTPQAERRILDSADRRETADDGSPRHVREAVRGALDAMRHDGRKGVLLSGGLDSAIIASELVRSSEPSSVVGVTYSAVGSGGRAPDDCAVEEVSIARAFAREHGVSHRVVPPLDGKAFLDLLVRSTLSMGSPAGNCWLPHFACYSVLAEEGVRVAYTGDGADDLFGGYVWRYRDPAVPNDAPISYRHVDFDVLLPVDLREHCRAVEREMWQVALDRTGGAASARVLLARQRLLPNLLQQTDAVAGWHSMEARVPFVERSVWASADSIPIPCLVQDGVGKVPLRRAFAEQLGPGIAWGPKVGFVAAETTLYRSELAPLLQWLVLGSPLWDLLPTARLGFRRLVENHLTGQQDGRKAIWSLLALDAWLRLAVQRQCSEDVLSAYLGAAGLGQRVRQGIVTGGSSVSGRPRACAVCAVGDSSTEEDAGPGGVREQETAALIA